MGQNVETKNINVPYVKDVLNNKKLEHEVKKKIERMNNKNENKLLDKNNNLLRNINEQMNFIIRRIFQF